MSQFRVVKYDNRFYPQFKVLWLFWRNYRNYIWDCEFVIHYDTVEEAIEHIHKDVEDIKLTSAPKKSETMWEM